MKKRICTLLAAAGVLLALAPAAFAVPVDDVMGPEIFDVPEYQEPAELEPMTADEPAALASDGVTGTGTETDPYCINSLEGFVSVVTSYTNDYKGNKHFKLMTDLNLNDPAADGIRPGEWGSYIQYLDGNFDGGGHTISGIPENCFFIMAWHSGTIENLNVEMGGQAATLVYSYFTVGGQYGETKMDNVTVTSSSPITLDSNDQANYAPFIFCSGPYFTMSNCTNYADITGVTYASVFYGYNPLPVNGYPTDASVNITDCTNHGNVTLRYAGLVFGNPTYLSSSRNITITGLRNYGVICGTESAHYFASDAGGKAYETNEYFKQMEADISANGVLALECNDANCEHRGKKGGIINGTELVGFGISVDSDTKAFKITSVENATVTRYVVTVSHYVNLFDDAGNKLGTDRVSYSEEIMATETLETDEVFDYLLKDGEQPEGTYTWEWLPEQNVYELYDDTTDELVGYWLDNAGEASTEQWHYYLSSNQEQSEVQWDVYASAYNGEQLLGTVALTR